MGDAENAKLQEANDNDALVSESDEMSPPVKPSGLGDPAVVEAIRNQLKNRMGICPSIVPKHLKKKVKALKKLQLEHVNLETNFFKELHALEIKYDKLFAPYYERRKSIVTGSYEPTEEECDFPSDSEDVSEEMEDLKISDNIDDNATKNDEIDAKDIKGIPEFWLTAFKHASVVSDIIEEHDEPILKHLLDVKAITSLDPMGFTLEFYFAPNDYFTNTVLTKHYEMKCELDKSDPFSFDGPEIYKCKGCTIDWKKGMNVTVKTVKKKQKHKARGAVRMVSRTVQNDSFFNFFNPPAIPENEDDEQDEELQNTLTADFEIGNYIKDNIIPQAVLFYTGENLVDDEFDEEEEDEDEEFDEEDDDSENETGSQHLIKNSRGGNRMGQTDKMPPEYKQPPECKQQ